MHWKRLKLLFFFLNINFQSIRIQFGKCKVWGRKNWMKNKGNYYLESQTETVGVLLAFCDFEHVENRTRESPQCSVGFQPRNLSIHIFRGPDGLGGQNRLRICAAMLFNRARWKKLTNKIKRRKNEIEKYKRKEKAKCQRVEVF